MISPLFFRKRSGFQLYRISKVHADSSQVLGSRGRMEKKKPPATGGVWLLGA
jgi:hypothetical protein